MDDQQPERGLDRRTFLKATGAGLGAGGALLTPGVAGADAARNGDAGVEASAGAEASARAEARIQRYGRLGRTGISISDISFGSSRLRTGEEELVRHALDKGVNYFDTADSYTRGQSETVIGRALQGDRDRVAIVTKTKVWADDDRQSIMRALEGSLRRLQTDYVDVFFNHAVNDTDRLDNPEWHEFVELAKRQGKIRFTGLSGHAGRLVDVVDHAVDGDLVDVLLVSFNFGQDPGVLRVADPILQSHRYPERPAGRPGARQSQKDMGVIAMKTLMGARLNDMRPYESAGATFAQAAFRWTFWRTPSVDALVVSMTGREQIDEYPRCLRRSGQVPGARTWRCCSQYAALNGTSYCRQACNDCAGACPYGVPIADVLRTRMYAVDYERPDLRQRRVRRPSRPMPPPASAAPANPAGIGLQPWARHRRLVCTHPSDAGLNPSQ